jgi:hypothetical protein
MFKRIGFSVYLSNFEKNKEQLSSLSKGDSVIFTSLHLSEEYDDSYIKRAEEMCKWLQDAGFRIMADVSRKTLKMFKTDNIVELAEKMKIDILRIDYGYSVEEIAEISGQMPVCINATTLEAESIRKIAKDAVELYAMHNFYPRPETGLDCVQFIKSNQVLRQAGIKVLAFIPGDMEKRGPLYEGLPTLESHRKAAPYAAYIDLINHYSIDTVFVGDGVISPFQLGLIADYERDGIISLPVKFEKIADNLSKQIYTIRADSPRWLLRLQESREYSCFGKEIVPFNSIERKTGAVTIDNNLYKRYSGEIQIIKEPLPADERVNVIGMIPQEYQLLLRNISNGDKIRFVKI